MATKEMKTLTLNEQQYEIVDEAAREDISALQTEVGYYGTCSTVSTTAAKTVTVSDSFVLTEGASVKIKFNDTNTASSPTLNVNETGDIAMIMYDGTAVGTYEWRPGAVVAFTYDGTNWVIQQPATATTTYYGLTKLSSSVSSTYTTTAATSSAVRTAYNAAVAAQETADANAADIDALEESVSELNSNALTSSDLTFTTLAGTGLHVHYNSVIAIITINCSGVTLQGGTSLTDVLVWPSNVTLKSDFLRSGVALTAGWVPTTNGVYFGGISSNDYISVRATEAATSAVLVDTFVLPRSWLNIS